MRKKAVHCAVAYAALMAVLLQQSRYVRLPGLSGY